ncbi:MAG TPA: hypothetical protein GXX34_06495 [Clostridia bacterium]|nr:hypothetical protein [Clostridia bacterium]
MRNLQIKVAVFTLLLLVALGVAVFHAGAPFKEPGAGEGPENKNRSLPGEPKEYAGGLPWEEDPEFLQALETYDTPRLMAQFKAELKNPFYGELANVKLAAETLKGTVVKPGEIFSQNQTLGPYTREKGYQVGPMFVGTRLTESIGGGVCKIATLLYNAAVLANLEVVERHHHSMPVTYVSPGQDATVAYGIKDLKFKNTTPDNILIWAGTVGNVAYIGFYGKTEPPKVTWEHRILQEVPFQTVYRDDPTLPLGEEKILVDGLNGCLVETELHIDYPDGRREVRHLGKSWYHPMPQLILRGTGKE